MQRLQNTLDIRCKNQGGKKLQTNIKLGAALIDQKICCTVCYMKMNKNPKILNIHHPVLVSERIYFFLHLALSLNTKTENKNKLNVINWVTLNVVFWWKNQRKKKLLKTKHCTIFSNIKTKTHLEDIILKNYPYKKKTEISNKLFLCNNLYNWCLKKKKTLC